MPLRSCLVGSVSIRYRDPARTRHTGDVYLEVSGDRRYLAFYDNAEKELDEGPYRVSEGEVFVVGDNRRLEEDDSRGWSFGRRGSGLPRTMINGVPSVLWAGANPYRIGLDLATPHVPATDGTMRRALDECLTKLTGISL